MHKENQKRNKCLSYVTRNCDRQMDRLKILYSLAYHVI